MNSFSAELLDSVFHAYDIRGKTDTQLTEDFFYELGRAYVYFTQAKNVVVGHDIREESIRFSESLMKGITSYGADVSFIGETATEMMYFAVGSDPSIDGGIAITASHNPTGWCGAKMVGKQVKPLSGDSGLKEIKELLRNGVPDTEITQKGKFSDTDIYPLFKAKVLKFLEGADISNLNLIVDAGNGIGGRVFNNIFGDLGASVEELYFEPDGSFPNHVPNPILSEHIADIKAKIKSGNFDLGIAIDGDADRAFFLDKNGRNPIGVYIGTILAKHYAAKKEGGATVLHDPRVTRSVIGEAKNHNYNPVVTKAGHAFIKEKMKEYEALFGFELSSHFYYKDFYYADSGMITIAIMLNLIANGLNFEEELDYLYNTYLASGEINFTIDRELSVIIADLKASYPDAHINEIDGTSFGFDTWRFNLRASNTEPVVRLNLEADTIAIMREAFEKISSIIGGKRENDPILENLI